MDSEGNFIANAHFNRVRPINASDAVSSDKIERALGTRVEGGYSYCLDSGASIFLASHEIENSNNLRNLSEALIVETATPTGNLLITQEYDVGEISGVCLCPEATVSLLPPDIANDCGVSVHLVKIGGRVEGQHACKLVANEKEIGGDDVEYLFFAKRVNKLWWLNETQVADLAFRRGFPEAEFNRVQEYIRAREDRDQDSVRVERANYSDKIAKSVRFDQVPPTFNVEEKLRAFKGVEDYEDVGLDGPDGKAQLLEDKILIKKYVSTWSRVLRLTNEYSMEQWQSEDALLQYDPVWKQIRSELNWKTSRVLSASATVH